MTNNDEKQDKINENEYKSFLSRIKYIMGDRKINPWGTSIGLSRGTINRISLGKIPASEGLSAISRAENVSLSWLLNGFGSPYIVSHTIDDEGAYNHYSAATEEPGWTKTIITDGSRSALVLQRPGEFDVGKQTINYQILDIIPNAGQITLKAVRNDAATTVISPWSLTQLIKGWTSNNTIMHYINSATKQEIRQIADARANYNSDANLARAVQLFKTLPNTDKHNVLDWMESISNNLLLRCIHEIENALEAEQLKLERDEVMLLAQQVYAQARAESVNVNQIAQVIDISSALERKR